MKILYVTTISNTINAFLVPHIKMLKEDGHTVDIACSIEQPLNEDIKKIVSNIYNIPFSRNPLKLNNIKAYFELKEIFNDYDVVHCHTPNASAITRLAAKKNKNIKVIYTAHGFHFFKGAPLKNWLLYYPIEKYLSKFTDTIVTINNEDYEIAKNKFKSRSTKYIPGVGVDMEKFKPINYEGKINFRCQYGYKKEDYILIYVAELNKNKNQEVLIKAISELKENIPEIKLLLVGKGKYKEKYENLIFDLKLENNIKLLGYRKDIPELMNISDVCITSSLREGLPVNVIEAMAVGLPVIASDCRGNRDLIINEINGVVLNENISESYQKAISKYSIKEQRDFVSLVNIESAKEYSIKDISEKIKEVYNF